MLPCSSNEEARKTFLGAQINGEGIRTTAGRASCFLRSVAACCRRCCMGIVPAQSSLSECQLSTSTSSAAARRITVTGVAGAEEGEATGATDRWCLQRLSWTWREQATDKGWQSISVPVFQRYTITLFTWANKIKGKKTKCNQLV